MQKYLSFKCKMYLVVVYNVLFVKLINLLIYFYFSVSIVELNKVNSNIKNSKFNKKKYI